MWGPPVYILLKKKDLVPPGFEQGTSGFEVQRLNHWTAEARLETQRKLGEGICLKGTLLVVIGLNDFP